jgi:hypothetical protein
MRGWRPWLAATVITGVMACGMLFVGVAAAANPRGVTPSDRPGAVAVAASTDPQSQLAQLQALVQQYQTREQQYQTQLAQDQAALQEYQQVLVALQQSGVIRISSDGQIFIRGAGGN